MNHDERQCLRALLQDAGLKVSLTRLKILEVLHVEACSLNARELHERLLQSGEQVSLLSVRQVQGRMKGCGLVRKQADGRFRLCLPEHPVALAS